MELTKVKLGDYLDDFGDGIHGTPNYDENGEYYFINGNNLDNGAIFIDSETKRISSDEYESIKRNLNNRTLLLSINGTLGKLAYYNGENIALGKSACFLNFKENTDRRYFRYILEMKDFKQYMFKVASGSTIKNFSPRQAAEYEFFAPKIEDQKKIASVLSALDEKIALNKKMNQKLERMAKRLYDYWFVQYDFPDKNGHPYKTTGGPMTYNPTLKREIPEGWEVAPISEFIEKNFNGEWGKEEASEDDIRVHCVRGADIVDMVDMPVRYISTKKKDRILNPNDIIVEISGGSPTQSTGRATFVTRNTLNRFDSPMTCSNFCQIIRLKDAKCASYFFEMWQKFYASDIFFNFEGKTSGIKNFQTDSFIATPWAHPPKELMYKFDEMYQSFMRKKERLIAENQKLTALRDKLLPLLMNGQVVVN